MTRPVDRPKPPRDSLAALLDQSKSPQPIPREILVQAAQETGFAAASAGEPAAPPGVAGSAEQPGEAAAEVVRPVAPPAPREKPSRQRNKVGRDNVFNVRINDEAYIAIYEVANSRNIPLAQVIEEAMALYMAQGRGGGR